MRSDLIDIVGNIITQGKKESEYPENSLERMALKASRLGDDEKANKINSFLSSVLPELQFFRAVSASLLPERRGMAAIAAVRNYFTQKKQHLRGLNPGNPFSLVEGFSRVTDNDAKQLTGPFFVVAAANFTAYPVLGPDIRNYLFSQPDDLSVDDKTRSVFELRIMSEKVFDGQIRGSSWESTTIDDHRKLQYRGSIQDVFAHAVVDMTRFSLGYNAPAAITDKWVETLRNMDSESPENKF